MSEQRTNKPSDDSDQWPNWVRDLILALRAPEITPEFEALHKRIAEAMAAGVVPLTDALLSECTEPECIICGQIVCPHHEPLHFHHDGCPACYTPDKGEEDGIAY